MKRQIQKIIETEGLSPAKFADEIGVQRSSVSHILSGRNKPSYDLIIKILERFSGINAEWLLTGNGDMIKSSKSLQDKSDKEVDLFSYKEPKDLADNAVQKGKVTYNKVEEENRQTNENMEKEDSTKHKFTSVNNIEFILICYENGEFRKFNYRK